MDEEKMNELIGQFEDAFRQEIQEGINSGNLSREDYSQYFSIINVCIDLFSWKAAMVASEFFASLKQ